MGQRSTDSTATQGGGSVNGKSRFIWLGIALIFLVVGVIFYFAHSSVVAEEESFDQTISNELQSLTTSRGSEVSTWVKSMLDHTYRFTNADVVRVFAEEVDRRGDAFNPVKAAEAEDSDIDMQLMQNHLRDFGAYADFLNVAMSNRNGDIYISTDSLPSLTLQQKAIVANVIKTGKVAYGSVNASSSHGLILPMYIPVNSFVKDADGNYPTIAVMVLYKGISPKLNELFSSNAPSHGAFILQRHDNNWQNVAFSKNRIIDIPYIAMDEQGNIPFGTRESIESGRTVYSRGLKIAGTDWWVAWEQDYEYARRDLETNIRDKYIRAGLTCLALVMFFGAIWWWLVSHQRSQFLNQSQQLNAVIEKQKRLLDSINGTIADPISLTDSKGVYRYVNRAFASAVGRDVKDIPGLDVAAVFGFDTARRFNSTDQHVLMTGEPVTTEEMVWLQSERHYYQVAKSPLREGNDRTPTGIVSVYRDVTALKQTEERTRRVVQQTINALVRAIEQSDPFLGGHSRIMSEVAKLLCRGLKLSEKDTSTIEAAAALSQVGKMFVPREILTKPGILTDDEKKIMEKHVEHTRNILKGVEFGVPVIDAIYQMNERPDGKGYPLGLKDEDINIYAKVLAVANAFTAMARPRSYRPAMEVPTVLATLEKQSGAYDPEIVKILREVMRTAEGEKIAEMAATSQGD